MLAVSRREPEERWHIQQVMECSMFRTGDELIEQLQVCPLPFIDDSIDDTLGCLLLSRRSVPLFSWTCSLFFALV